ncbi:hypothetical protein ACIO7M_32955 [Streptomyces toxytricini]|uniref:Transposase n=1 Tax=Streptomyces toxytricini TaxID=67369 RepID=A0ABW8ETD4_STRT5
MGTAHLKHGADVALFVTTCRTFTKDALGLALRQDIVALHRDLLDAWVKGAHLESLIPLNGSGGGIKRRPPRLTAACCCRFQVCPGEFEGSPPTAVTGLPPRRRGLPPGARRAPGRRPHPSRSARDRTGGRAEARALRELSQRAFADPEEHTANTPAPIDTRVQQRRREFSATVMRLHEFPHLLEAPQTCLPRFPTCGKLRISVAWAGQLLLAAKAVSVPPVILLR